MVTLNYVLLGPSWLMFVSIAVKVIIVMSLVNGWIHLLPYKFLSFVNTVQSQDSLKIENILFRSLEIQNCYTEFKINFHYYLSA